MSKTHNDEHWFLEWFHLIKCYGAIYIAKFILFTAIVLITISFSDWHGKALSTFTFLSSILIDSLIIHLKYIKKKSNIIDLIQFIYMFIIFSGTIFLACCAYIFPEPDNIILFIINTLLFLGLGNPIIELTYNIPEEEKKKSA